MDIPFTVKARPDTGLWNAKIAIWLFLASEVMLFGGLFSAYIFLRMASDTPWPTHTLDITGGFINTLILIASSITVLQAWLSLKMRKYNHYVIYMVFTLGFAATFMFIKIREYGTKLEHYGVRLQDGSVLEGHLHHGYDIKFGDVSKITLATRPGEMGLFGYSLGNPGSDAGFLGYLPEGTKVEAKDEDGKDVVLDAGMITSKVAEERSTAQRLNAARAKAELYLGDHDKDADKENDPRYKEANDFLKDPKNKAKDTIVFTTKPLKFTIPPGKLASYDNGKAIFRDGTVIEGKLEDDSMLLTVNNVDLRMLVPESETSVSRAFSAVEKSDALRILGSEWQEAFKKHKEEYLHKHGDGKAALTNTDAAHDAFTMSLEMHEGSAGASVPHTGNKAEESAGEHKPAAAKAGEEPEVTIKKSDIQFYSNFTPKYHNYYALYFALTSLHGLHIIGGAIVLAYFLIFGRKMYETNPEHLTNRVEVGGLFWHFVDVVWMILFPVLYLM